MSEEYVTKVEIRPGVSIAFKDDWFGPQWEDKETVLLIHGIAESSIAWSQWVPLLAARFRVIRIDLPGFGGSAAPPGYDFTPATYSRDIATFLDRVGLAKVHVIGAKYGGSIAMDFAITHPARVSTLCIFGSPAKVSAAHFDQNGRSTEDSVRADREGWIRRTMPRRLGSSASPAQVAWHTELMMSADPQALIGTTTAIGKIDFDDHLHKIAAPSLIVTTEESGLQSIERTREYQQKIPKSELVVLPGDYYHVSVMAPETCARQAIDFIARASRS